MHAFSFRDDARTVQQRMLDIAASVLEGDMQSGTAGRTRYSTYAEDPAGFGRDVLGEHFTEDIVYMLECFRDNPITIVESANAVGKTHAAARAALWFYKVFGESQVYTAAAPPVNNLSTLLWGEIKSVVSKHPEVFSDDAVANGMWISRGPRSYVTGVAIPQQGTPEQRQAKFSGKHAPHLAFVIDEGDAIPPEIYKAIESCMSGGMARLLILFNPRHESGPLYQMAKGRRAKVVNINAFRHPNVTTGRDRIPGAVTREQTVRRINEWTRRLTTDELATLGDEVTTSREYFQVPEFLIGTTAPSLDGQSTYPPLDAGVRKIEDPDFSVMVLGQYPSTSTRQLISREWIDRAISNWKLYTAEYGEAMPVGSAPIMGLDVAEFGKDKNVCTLRAGNYVARPRFWTGVDPIVTADRAFAIYAENGCSAAHVDGIGVGSGTAPAMARYGAEAYSIKVSWSPTEEATNEEGFSIGSFDNLRDQGFWQVREWLRLNRSAMIPDDEELIEELLAFEYFKTQKQKLKVSSSDALRTKLRRSPDKVTSLMLTFCQPEEHGAVTINEDNYLTDQRPPSRNGIGW